MKNKINSRILYFDYLKAVSIFLVVFCHKPWLDKTVSSNFTMLLCTLAVPLFFMVNGALLFSHSFNTKKHYRKILHLFLVMVSWKLLYLVLSLVFKQISIDSISFTGTLNYLLGSEIKNVPSGHFWFINALIFCYLLFPVLKMAYDQNKKLILYLALCCLICCQAVEEFEYFNKFFNAKNGMPLINIGILRNTLNPIGQYGNMLFFFLAGALTHETFYIKKKQFKFQKTALLVSFLIGFGWLVLEKYIQVNSLLWTGQSFIGGYKKVGTVLMTLCIFICCSQIPFKQNKLFSVVGYIGNRTLDIYYIHMFLANLAIIYVFPHLKMQSVLINTGRSIVIICISLGIGLIIRAIPFVKKLLQ